ncbi:MAG: outer membrane beta-barrel protein [Steroidobacteraceae bacterium]
MTWNVTWAASPTVRLLSALALAGLSGVATAQSDKPWDGIYAGLNAGGSSSSICQNWTPSGAGVGPAMVGAFSNRDCSNGGTFAGGFQIGDNVQYQHLLLGLGADFDVATAASQKEALKYSGTVLPAGTYAFSGKLSPDGFATFGPRMGYAGRQALAYVTAGVTLPVGPNKSQFSFTPVGTAKSIASFDGGRNFAAAGWVAGGGAEWGLNGPWSISAEYLHTSLGRGGDVVAPCTGSASACAVFSGLSFESSHTNFNANVFRIGVNYWFGYWAL